MVKEIITKKHPLIEEEAFILRNIKMLGKPIGEHNFHMMIKIATDAFGNGMYNFRPEMWGRIEGVYENISYEHGCLPYSDKLHEQIELLIAKGYLTRNSEEPIIIFENRQLELFN